MFYTLVERNRDLKNTKFKCGSVWTSMWLWELSFQLCLARADIQLLLLPWSSCSPTAGSVLGTRVASPGEEECHQGVTSSAVPTGHLHTSLSRQWLSAFPCFLGSVFRNRLARNQDPHQSSTKIKVSRHFYFVLFSEYSEYTIFSSEVTPSSSSVCLRVTREDRVSSRRQVPFAVWCVISRRNDRSEDLGVNRATDTFSPLFLHSRWQICAFAVYIVQVKECGPSLRSSF